jgi:hypothetical protein
LGIGLRAGENLSRAYYLSKIPLNGFYKKNMMQRSLRINSGFADITSLNYNNKIAGEKQ